MPPVLTTAPPATGIVRRLTGLKPTGHLQLGNLVGAIAPMVAAQPAPAPAQPASASASVAAEPAPAPAPAQPARAAVQPIVAVVDLHALTVDHRPHEVRALTLEQVTTLLAAGVDPQLTTLYVQSHVPEHSELHYLLECVTGYGEAHRMIQFREKSTRQRQVRLSLLTYPVLMAADILLQDTDEVPVGDDQTQHLELARTIAARFNARYGDTFTVPRAAKPAVGARLMDLADPSIKMDKSTVTGTGVLRLLDPPDVVSQKIRRAVTDGDGEVRYDPASKPGVSNLLEILAACTGGDPAALASGLGSYRQLKAATSEAVIGVLAPIQRRYAELARERDYLSGVLARGAEQARERAATTVARARRALGLLPR